MRISIASDHAGFEQKSTLCDYLRAAGYDVLDRGPENDDRVDYPDFAESVARDVADGRADRGVLICGTGIGMAIAANKISGIRAANITNTEFAKLAREHNDINVITLSGRFVDPDTNKKILTEFLTSDFEGGRHSTRLDKIKTLEQTR